MGGEKWSECEYTLKPLCNHISLRKFKEMLARLMNESNLVRCRPTSTQTLAAVFKNLWEFSLWFVGGILQIFQFTVTSRIERFQKSPGYSIPILPANFKKGKELEPFLSPQVPTVFPGDLPFLSKSQSTLPPSLSNRR